MNRKGEWILWGAAAFLLLATCALSAAGTPDFAPVTVTYSSISGPSSDLLPLPSGEEQPFSEASGGETAGASSVPSASSTGTVPSVPSSSVPSVPPVSATTTQGKINLNTAGKDELMTIKGLGEVLAERILDYRERHGGFDSLEELMEVEGIGEKRFASWKPYLTV